MLYALKGGFLVFYRRLQKSCCPVIAVIEKDESREDHERGSCVSQHLKDLENQLKYATTISAAKPGRREVIADHY